ncbi:chemotaxis protein CheR [Flavobacterium noncentrifugens]|uniref:histidine kinase n=1 Tax=Flavobacterium noncentrifugens TaxID=1128970 RepID=A0A1G8UWE0_9FLAO|nr:chemotaxis protein CheB [Flavobacterium noncentrifugens]GEP52687.1 chemotaxis protein CheR [Flavobacterium noncentrifugens]SDJ57877.1 Methylase of chemotaxis methyl-accepting proteins [Flavobacterium noncentrifugens]
MEEPSYIIAIGASAGGIEEINTFFEHTPLDSVAYVIVQHLSADFKSRMVELLSKHSKLIVKEAAQGMAVCTNMVYLIPNNKFMTINNNKLYLTDKSKLKGPHLTINTFFNSLAAYNGKKAIGVILSGLGSDGTEGIRAIKEAGGMIIARNPETTEFSSMPAHAIATDMVDFILEPEFMPKTIESYVKHNTAIQDDKKNDDKSIALIVDHIREKLPFDFSDYKKSTIIRRTKRRAASLNIYSLDEYLVLLKDAPDEVEALAKDFLISVTAFFRDADAFEAVKKNVFPKILESLLPQEEIKIWVAGCATGEEAYSLAIMLKEMLTGNHKETIVKIFATDIDSEALIYAGKGIYGSERMKNVNEAYLNKYFDKKENNYIVRPEIRKMLIFAQHDLVKNPPYCNMHLISCRNLLIYMAPVLQKKVYTMLLFGLRTNGYLFLGSSENPLTILDNLEVVDKKWRIYKNLKNKRSVTFETFALPEMLHVGRTGSVTKEDSSKYLNSSLTENINNALANSMNFLAVCVDHENTVIKSYGNTSKYLLQQNFNTNLVELLPKSLAVAFNTLSKEVLKTNEASNVKGIRVKQSGSMMEISLTVSPVLLENDHKGLIVVFQDDISLRTGMEQYPAFDETEYNRRYTDIMAEELKQVKKELTASYHKLDASNENMQSFNEELISANEEMQSTNEEMQSVNEELHTINADYQLKNKELLEINDDLNNYFRSNINGQLFIDNEMRLMKFSPGAVKHINLVETDIGRPISHISTNIKFETIIADTKLVLEKGIVITKEIEAANGKWYQIMIMPYIEASHRNKGAIITFNDISELKETQSELKNKNRSLMRINADLDHFIHATSHDLLAPLGNIEASIALMNELNIEDSNLSEFLLIINSSIQTFRSLITDIATIAKVESDLVPTEAIDVSEIINNIEWSLKDKIASSGAEIVRKFDIPEIQFSKKNLRSILYNLIANAIKFRSDKSPKIIVSTFSKEESCIITIEDNGKGIPPKEIDKIFEMYGRLHQDIEGSGIGLYLAKKIINAAGGSILVESTHGKGTKFIIDLGSKCAI